jgi:hypothetical protein
MGTLAKRQYAQRQKPHVEFIQVLNEKQKRTFIKKGNLIQTELGPERRCPICGEYWPYDNDFFYDYKSACIACFSERKARYQEEKQCN